MHHKPITLAGVAALLVTLVADQVLKSWAHAAVAAGGAIPVVPGFNIVASHNSGVAFGLATGSEPWVLILVGLVLSGWLVVWLMRTRSCIHAIGLGLAIGGALGNVADRVRLGVVRDYIDVFWSDVHWPAFNLADAAIVFGLAAVILFKEQEPAPEPARQTDREPEPPV